MVVVEDATTIGQLVILAGLVISALTQIALAYINRREIAAKAEALEAKVDTRAASLAAKVDTTAAHLAVEQLAARRETEALVRRTSNEVRDAAARMARDLDARFDRLVPPRE